MSVQAGETVLNRKPFGFFKRNFFPVHEEEYSKFFHIFFMFTLIPFVYALARGNKDALVGSIKGNEVSSMISSLKLFAVIPFLWAFKHVYSMVSRRVTSRRRYTFVVLYFALSFLFLALYVCYREFWCKLQPEYLALQETYALLNRQLDELKLSGASAAALASLEAQIVDVTRQLNLTDNLWGANWIGDLLASSSKALETFEGPWYDKLLMKAFYINFFKSALLVIQYWPVALYYVTAECYGSFVLAVGFWTFVNTINTSEESKRFYIPFMVGAGASTAFAGVVMTWELNFAYNFLILSGVVFFLAFFYNYFEYKLEKYPAYYQLPGGQRKEEKKKKRSAHGLMDSINYLRKDPYARNIAFKVLAYGLIIAIVEIMYRGLLSHLKGYLVCVPEGGSVASALLEGELPTVGVAYKYIRIPSFGMKKILGMQLMGIGILQAVFSVVGTRLGSSRSWRFVALATPVITIVGTFPFLVSYLFGSSLNDGVWEAWIRWANWTIQVPTGAQYYIHLKEGGYQMIAQTDNHIYWHLACVYLGVLGGVLIKSVKYVAFDTSKERLIILGDQELRTEGKAKIDAIASRLGKAIISFFNAVLFPVMLVTLFSVDDYNPYRMRYTLSVMAALVMAVWLRSVFSLSEMYEARVKKMAKATQAKMKKAVSDAVKKTQKGTQAVTKKK